jgi:HNH endonuclease
LSRSPPTLNVTHYVQRGDTVPIKPEPKEPKFPKYMKFWQVLILDLLNRKDRGWSKGEICKELGLKHVYMTRVFGSTNPEVRSKQLDRYNRPSLFDYKAIEPSPPDNGQTHVEVTWKITAKGKELLKQQIPLQAARYDQLPKVTGMNEASAAFFQKIKRDALAKFAPEDSQEAQARHSIILGPEEADQRLPTDGDNYSPGDGDHRPLVERQIRERRGQQSFRDALMKQYGNRCVVTGCEVLDVLEAAHILAYRRQEDHHPENGLLLRSDIHTLFDLNLLGIEPDKMQVELHPTVVGEYRQLNNVKLRCTGKNQPSKAALLKRYKQFRQRLTQAN